MNRTALYLITSLYTVTTSPPAHWRWPRTNEMNSDSSPPRLFATSHLAHPAKPRRHVVTRGQKNGLDREKVHCGLHRWCRPLMCVWLWQKQWSRNNNCSRNHNRTPHRRLLTLSHRKIIRKCQFAFFALSWHVNTSKDATNKLNNFQPMSPLINLYISIWMCYKCFLLSSKSKLIYW